MESSKRVKVELEPHALYTWIWLDHSREEILFRDDVEKMQAGLRDPDEISNVISMYGWVYCVDCRTPIFDLETALDHVRHGHILVNRFMFDQVAAEEAPVSD